MATKAAIFGGPSPHTSGLFADMTVDGPEIGTLVLIVDRAKNLPNRKTMGKQNPYCAARLGKDARKTETDRRGGQTPRWDQELRFVVHDSPDYYKLKISIFSEDKRTDLIGEAWLDLADVITPKGGKKDLWQGLNYKGKYAGELRIEITYYDTRPKQDGAESVAGSEDFSVGSGTGRVKRRPLPSTMGSGTITPDAIPAPAGPGVPGRAKHGPRDLRMPPRANSLPPESMMHPQQQAIYDAPAPEHAYSSSVGPFDRAPPPQQYGYDHFQEPAQEHQAYDQHQQSDFLPQLPPSNRARGYQASAQRFAAPRPQPQPPQAHPHQHPPHHMGLPHSQSAPIVPQAQHAQHAPHDFDDGYQLQTDYPEPIPDLDFQHQQLASRHRRSDVGQDWRGDHNSSYGGQPSYEDAAPPPPPMHSNSAPVVPHFSNTHGTPMSSSPGSAAPMPPHSRHQSVPNTSPLQMMERGYSAPQRTPVPGQATRGMSVDGYMSSPDLTYGTSPSNYQSGQTPSSHPRPQPSRPLPHRNSIADSYQYTPPRPHPLSQEVPRPRSPLPPPPGPSPHSAGHSTYQQDFRERDGPPILKPRAISPQPPPSSQSNSAQRPKSSYSIQHPVRAFESADGSPLSTSRPPPPSSLQTSQRSSPARKSISPHPSAPNTPGGGTPFSPDSFNAYNPQASRATLPEGNSPHSPYQIAPGSSAPRDANNGPIVGWHGQEIDPSDHLPVDSWAPEPEKKTPTKTYGLGRDRDFGPRSGAAAGRNMSKDTVVNFRVKGQHPQQHQQQPLPPAEQESPSRNRLQKKPSPSPAPGRAPAPEPLSERHNFNSVSVPDPYAQQQYSQGFYGGGGGAERYENGGSGYAPNPDDSLAREIGSIDIGGRGGRGGGGGYVPAPTAYVPVRSHRERGTFY
ncbi:uncharacterized protein LTR77_006710 [Saxophila tyrrhenica]|uniref:C2 domain-containing protein n=1 Tax=Saxophila tyrrhenica TaxID=1690608 RepID=A0AAV9P5M1_9PEZI|nr:hypothetical protein LTR77_006710 [Saxophila tyrrhenica]